MEDSDDFKSTGVLYAGTYGAVRCAAMQDGTMPGLEFFIKLSASDQGSFLSLFILITSNSNLTIANKTNFKKLKGNLFEFKRSGSKKVRIFTFRDKNCWWIIGGYPGKKENEIPPGVISRALELMSEAQAVLAGKKHNI